MMPFRKKASLEISINAIVILVMAMVVLGLGLTFVRGLFDKGGGKLTEAIENNDLDNPATIDDPLTVDSKVKVRLNKEATFGMGFYNVGHNVGQQYVKVGVALNNDKNDILQTVKAQCVNSDGETPEFQLSTTPQIIAPGSASGFNVLIGAYQPQTDGGIQIKPGTYVCSVTIHSLQWHQVDGAWSYVPSTAASSLSEQIEVTVTG